MTIKERIEQLENELFELKNTESDHKHIFPCACNDADYLLVDYETDLDRPVSHRNSLYLAIKTADDINPVPVRLSKTHVPVLIEVLLRWLKD